MTTITIVMTCKLNIELVGGAMIRGLVRLVNSACVCVCMYVCVRVCVMKVRAFTVQRTAL